MKFIRLTTYLCSHMFFSVWMLTAFREDANKPITQPYADEIVVSVPDLPTVIDTASAQATTFQIDTLAVLTNQNLDKLLAKVEHDKYNESNAAQDLPSFIKTFLDQVAAGETGRFVLADYGQHFNSTDVVLDPTLPSRQLLYLGVGKRTIMLVYYKGGIGLVKKVLLFQINQNQITDFWTGHLSGNAMKKRDIIQKLRENKNKKFGVNTNFIYF